MIRKLLAKLFPKREIVNCFGNLYLTRWYLLRTPLFSIMLHKFSRSDEDRALHDHPWPFLVIPLRSGYTEISDKPCEACGGNGYYGMSGLSGVCSFCRGTKREPVARRVRPFFGTRFRAADYRHRVVLHACNYKGAPDSEDSCPLCKGSCELPAWSLFIRFRRCREWGYWLERKNNEPTFQHHQDWWKENCE